MQDPPGSGRFPWRRSRPPAPGFLDFPCGSAGKEPARHAGDLGSTSGLGRSPGEGERLTHSNVLAWRIPWTVYGEGWVEIYGSGNLQNEERQFTIPFSPLDDSVSLCLLKVRFLLNHKSENPDFFLLRLLFTAANCNGWLLNSRWKSSVRLWMRSSCLLAQCFVEFRKSTFTWSLIGWFSVSSCLYF